VRFGIWFEILHRRSPKEPAMRRDIAALLLALALASGAAQADQYSYVTVQQAADALRAIAKHRVVHAFCAPCGDTASQPLPVRTVQIGRVWEDPRGAQPYRDGDGRSYWQVYVNDAPVDLAYLYVPQGQGWENLALQLGLPASDVPRMLDAAQTGR
jgi:hypothetical protein